MVLEKQYEVYELLKWSLLYLPRNPERTSQYEKIAKIKMNLTLELYGKKSQQHCSDLVWLCRIFSFLRKDYESAIQEIESILKDGSIKLK